LAEPPAESPSTIYISQSEGSLSEQSANFPGRVVISSADFLLVSSLAFLAASLALEAVRHLSNIIFATEGFSSK
jgi:precorrin isomerase